MRKQVKVITAPPRKVKAVSSVSTDSTDATDNTLSLQWPECTISHDGYRELLKLVGRRYTKLDEDELRDYYSAALKLGIDQHTAASIKSIALKDRIIKDYPRLNANINQYRKQYLGTDILHLSEKYRFPPLTMLREILTKWYPIDTVRGIFNGKLSTSLLSKRDREQYFLAAKFDAESGFNQNLVAAIAAENELRVVQWFRKYTRIYTQEELVESDMKEYGRAVNTPDILFKDPVYINGVRIYWADFKDYACIDKFLLRSNIEQAGRYVSKWGPGALLYSGCVLSDIVIKDTLLLSTKFLPLV
jgi:hypothetical protein